MRAAASSSPELDPSGRRFRGDVPASSGTARSREETDSGALTVIVSTVDGAELARGTNTLEIRVVDTTGVGVDGLSLDVVPWMPAMDHGASVAPSVHPEGGGAYRVDNLELFMPGLWQLETSFAHGVSDHAAPSFTVD